MGLFDIFSNKDAQDAANAQIQGYQSGYNQLGSLYGSANNALTSNYGLGQGALGTNYGLASAAITNPLNTTVANNVNTANQGTTALGNALGLNGAAGNAAALAAFQNNPGYQFQLQQGLGAVQAKEQQMGQGNSGNALIDLSNYAQGQANQGWNQYIQNLQPYLGYSVNTTGQQLQGANNLANVYTGLGNQQNAAYQGLGQGQAGLLTGQGNAAYGSAVGQGNAQAQADYANLQQSQNLWNLFGNIASGGIKAAGQAAAAG